MRLGKCATPVKAKTSAPAPSFLTACAALTWRGFEEATRTGSRERGGGWRQTLDRQQNRGRSSASGGERTLREPFGRLRWSKDGCRQAPGGPLFREQKARWLPFSLSCGPQIFGLILKLSEFACLDSDLIL